MLVIEVKSSFLRTTLREAWSHASTTLRKAGNQLQRKTGALMRALTIDSGLCADLGLTTEIVPSLTGWIVDTSIEHDHERFSGFLKISLEEVIIALRNDRHLLSDPYGILKAIQDGVIPDEADHVMHEGASLYPQSFSAALDIRIQYCPKHQPRFKGVVERYLKTINYFLAHQLPGTSFARMHHRGEYDPLKHAVLTLAEFKHIFEKWVIDIYAQQKHRTLGVPTVLLGLPRVASLLQVNEQVRRRFSRRRYLQMGQQGETSVEAECLQLFLSLGDNFPIPVSCGSMGWSEMAQRIYFACDGRVAYIKKLLAGGIRLALEQELPNVGPQTLEIAFTQDVWWEGVDQLNPFNERFEFRRLNRANEPFEQVLTVPYRDRVRVRK